MTNISLLLVEDEFPLATLLADVLRRTSHQVTVVHSGRAAIDLMEDHHFDVILTDIVMPDGDGLEVMLAAKRWQPHAKLVAMSAGSTHLAPGYCLHLAEAIGSPVTLLKPFTTDQLLEAVKVTDPVLCIR